ncbi:hypothetical protein APHAL10511_008300 [Amanita phalloides]|nr:hypothetical protein APHAL10511_008300 [Amanita phalloides]
MFTIQLKLFVLAALCAAELASSTAVLRRNLGTTNRNTLDDPQDIPRPHVHTDTNGLDNHNASSAQEGSNRLGLGRLFNIRNSGDTIVKVDGGGMTYHSHTERPDSNQQSLGLLDNTVSTLYSTRQETKGVPDVHSDLDLTPKNNDSNKLQRKSSQLDEDNGNIN